MRWPFVVSLAVHAGGIVALCVVHGRAGRERTCPVELTCMRACEASPEVPERESFELPEVESGMPALDPIEAEPEAEEPAEIDFGAVAADDPSPEPLPIPSRMARIPPLRRRRTEASAPAPTAPTEAARVTSPVPCGDRCPPPVYPKAAQRRGIEGRVLLRVLVGRAGGVLSVEVEESSGSSLLDDAAVAAVREWIFEPAREGVDPVESLVRVPLRFRLRP